MRLTCMRPGVFLLAASVLLLTPALAWAEEGADPMKSGTVYNAIWAVGTFLVLFVILARYAWKPILRQMEQREKQVADTIAQAQSQQAESQKLLEQYRQQLATADQEAARQLAKTRQAAEQVKQEILSAAREEALKVSKQAAAEIENAKQDALDSLQRYAAELATDAAGKILRKELTPDDQRRLVAESLELIRQKAMRQ